MRHRIVSGLALLLLVSSCSRQSVAPLPISPTEQEVLVSMSERLPERTLVLSCRTVESFPCGNYALDARLVQDAWRIGLEFAGVIEPRVCITSFGPAGATLELAGLGAGQVPVELVNGSIRSQGMLETTADHYAATVMPGGVRFPEPVLQRIPPGTIWGMFGYATEQLAPEVQAIETELLRLGARPAQLPRGLYSVVMGREDGDRFRVSTNGVPDYGAGTGFGHVRGFALVFDGDPALIRALVARTGRAHGDSLHLRVHTASGESMYSWVLGRGL